MSTLADLLSTFTNCLFCFPSSPSLRINSRSFKMLRLLGEGGFSYVYLVQDTSTSQLYALKKIRCPFGQESVAQALKEVEAYSLFSGVGDDAQYVISAVDHQVKDEGAAASGIGSEGAGGQGGVQKTVYILLPYYRKGNLQDAINANLVNHTRFSEKRLLRLMIGVCKGLRALHGYRAPNASQAAVREARQIHDEARGADADMARQAKGKSKAKQKRQMQAVAQHSDDEDDHDEQPLMPTTSALSNPPGTATSYAHRDIKPGNIMLADDDTPILMDFGSLAPSPTPITSRSLALAVQDTAAEHSTMPYRAPELFDVKTGSAVDTKVDIWSLGCTMYACLVGKSPFEARSDETGGSLSICVLGGDWRWPDEGMVKKPVRQGSKIVEEEAGVDSGRKYPCEKVRGIVRRCLAVEPGERPDVDELMRLCEEVLGELGGGEEDDV